MQKTLVPIAVIVVLVLVWYNYYFKNTTYTGAAAVSVSAAPASEASASPAAIAEITMDPVPDAASASTTSTASITDKIDSVDDTVWAEYPQQDSTGSDIIPWHDPSNFGMTIDKCKARCLADPRCKGFGWDPAQGNYCSNKHYISPTLNAWTQTGILYVRK